MECLGQRGWQTDTEVWLMLGGVTERPILLGTAPQPCGGGSWWWPGAQGVAAS